MLGCSLPSICLEFEVQWPPDNEMIIRFEGPSFVPPPGTRLRLTERAEHPFTSHFENKDRRHASAFPFFSRKFSFIFIIVFTEIHLWRWRVIQSKQRDQHQFYRWHSKSHCRPTPGARVWCSIQNNVNRNSVKWAGICQLLITVSTSSAAWMMKRRFHESY